MKSVILMFVIGVCIGYIVDNVFKSLVITLLIVAIFELFSNVLDNGE